MATNKFFGHNETILTTQTRPGPLILYGAELREVPEPPGGEYNPPWGQWPISSDIQPFFTSSILHETEDRSLENYLGTQVNVVADLGSVIIENAFYVLSYKFVPDLPEFTILYQITISLSVNVDDATPPSSVTVIGADAPSSGTIFFKNQIFQHQQFTSDIRTTTYSFDYVHSDSSKPIYLYFNIDQGSNRTYTFTGTWSIREIKRYPMVILEWTLSSKFEQASYKGIDPEVAGYADYVAAYSPATYGDNFIPLPFDLYYRRT